MFLASLGVLSALTFAIIKKKIKLRDVIVSGIVATGFSILAFTSSLGYDMNSELSTEFKLTKERVSHINYRDSTISDSLLYGMIQNLRIPHAKIVFAQAKLESNTYRSELYKTNFNLFGMKYATIRPSVTCNEYMGYQRYANWKESVVDYLIWQFSNNVDKLDDARYMQYLHAVYAEDPNYIPKVKNIINNTNFKKFK